MQSAASTPKVNQRALQKPPDSPTRPALPYVDQVLRVSTGGSSHNCSHRGFSHGWLSSASSHLALGTVRMTLSQVSLPSSSSSTLPLTWTIFTRSVVLSVGSPALSAYSLVLTSLNARLVYRRVKRVDHGRNRNALARALISLQQTPLELTKNPKLLKFIPINDHWSQEIHDRLNRRNAWSVATASSVAWVVIAFLFTLVDSFVSLNDTTDAPSEGQAVGTLWLWLLCLVIGWLWVPTFTRGELKSAIGHANWRAVKKAAKLKRKARNAYKLAKTKVTHGLSKGMPILKVHKPRPADSPPPGADEDNEKVKSESGSIQEDTGPTGLSPLPDPTHHISTVSFQLPAGSQPDHGHSVSANPTANQSNASVQSSIRPGEDKLLNHKDLGWLNQDERRLAATFNYSRVIRYLVLVDDVLRALDNIAHEKGEVGLSRKRLILEVISPILNRSESSLWLPAGPRRATCSQRMCSSRCSKRSSPPSSSSAERPPQP